MGAWPEFHTCCWVVPLKSATIFIGICTLMLNVSRVVGYVSAIALYVAHEEKEDEPPSEEVLYSIVVFTWYIVIAICEAIVGAIVLLSINKAYLLRKTVSFMTVLWLLNLLISLINASREAYLDAYINAVSMLMNAYFILIIRSYHLKIEGRLGATDSCASSISDNFYPRNSMSFRTPPPNYEEALRNYEDDLPPSYNEIIAQNTENNTDSNNTEPEINNSNEIVNENNDEAAVLPVQEQRTDHSRRLSRQLSLSQDSQCSDESSNRRHSVQVTDSNVCARSKENRRKSSPERPVPRRCFSNSSIDNRVNQNSNDWETQININIGIVS